MLKKLRHLFIPHQSNNQKAKVLHHSSLFIILFLVVGFQSGLTLVTRISPGVLGFASNIDIDNLLKDTNQQRLERGINPVKLDEKLSEAAQQKAATMFNFNCWAHNCNNKTPWWFFENVGYNYLYAGENLARDFNDSDAVVRAWMDSPTHRENILNSKYKEIGFAIVDGLMNGEETTLVVQMFGTEGGPAQIASGEKIAQVQAAEQINKSIPEIMITESVKPIISSFVLTKAFAISLVCLLIFVLLLDTYFIYRHNIVRISGKNFVHLSFFIIILISILLSYQGEIL
jgi:hypothetical protein